MTRFYSGQNIATFIKSSIFGIYRTCQTWGWMNPVVGSLLPVRLCFTAKRHIVDLQWWARKQYLPHSKLGCHWGKTSWELLGQHLHWRWFHVLHHVWMAPQFYTRLRDHLTERSTKHHGCTMSGRNFRHFAIILGSASIASSRGLKTLALTNGEEPEIEDAGEVAPMGLMGWGEDTWRMVRFERWYISHSRPGTMKVSSEVIASIIHHPFLPLLAFRSSSLCSPLSFFIKGCNLNQIRHFWPDTMRREWFGSHQRQLLGMANAPRQSSGASFWIVKHVEYNQNLARCPLLTTHILSLFSSRSM